MKATRKRLRASTKRGQMRDSTVGRAVYKGTDKKGALQPSKPVGKEAAKWT